jgi:hypothetical protein
MKFITSLILLTFSLFVYGQDTTKTQPKKKLSLTGYFGGHFVQIPKLEAKLKSIGYEKPTSGFFSFGLGLKYGQQRAFGGIDISLYMIGSTLNTSSTAFQFQGFFNYNIVDNDKLSIAPGLDIGLQQVKTDFKRANPSNNFDTLFLSSGNYVKLTNLTPVAGISTIFHFKRLDKSKNIFLRSFAHTRIGYKYGIQSNPWKADGNSILNSPSDRLSSFYVQLLWGF